MWINVVDLRDFYANDLGRITRRMIRRKLRSIWPDVSGQSVLGLGYAVPYLQSFQGEATRVISAMPAGQGILHWPDDGKNLTALVDEFELPLADLSMDRVVLVHALECAEQIRPLMREIWRVMSESGRLIVVAPTPRSLPTSNPVPNDAFCRTCARNPRLSSLFDFCRCHCNGGRKANICRPTDNGTQTKTPCDRHATAQPTNAPS